MLHKVESTKSKIVDFAVESRQRLLEELKKPQTVEDVIKRRREYMLSAYAIRHSRRV